MIKIWGRNTSSNVQKVMWAVGEMKLPHERIDVGGAFGKNKEPAYLAMNPNGLVPTLEEEDGFTLWESNSIVRYLAAKHASRHARARRPARRARWRTSGWTGSSRCMGPAITPVFWGLIRTPPEKRDANAIAAGKVKTDRGREDSRRAARQDRISRRRRVLLWRHPGRHHDLPLHAAHSGAAADPATSIAGTPRSRRAPRSRSRSRRCRCVGSAQVALSASRVTRARHAKVDCGTRMRSSRPTAPRPRAASAPRR